MTQQEDTGAAGDETGPTERIVAGLDVRRRDVMVAAGSAGVIAGGFAGVASANECNPEEDDLCCGECEPKKPGPDLCRECIPEACKLLEKADNCNVEPPTNATHAAIKAGQECHTVKLSSDIDICDVDDECGGPGFSHVEFYACPSAEATVDCPSDRARIDVTATDEVYFEVSYRDCDPEGELDEPTSGTLTFDDDAAGGTSDDWHTFVPLADCEGTITVWDDDSEQTEFDSADFDCESGTVTADCEADEITVFAEDTTDLWYEIDFENCDVDDVGRTQVSGLDADDTDEVTILEPIPNCAGTVTLYEDEGSQESLDSDTFDCVTATVEVECETDETGDAEATITAPDAETVWYEIDYDNCDVDDVGRTEVDLSGADNDSVTFDIAECDGTISVYDAENEDARLLDSATIDCADATVSVACDVDEKGEAEATIFAPDTDPVWYEIDYDNCDADDVSRTRLDLPGDTDEETFDIAECDGTITVHDAAESGTEIASVDFTCADAEVSVACALDELGDATATIKAPDAETVWYSTSYENCDESGVTREEVDLSGDKDEETVGIAECDGTIDVYDSESGGNLIASAEIDCADATVDVECDIDELGDATATITAPDAETVWYSTSYENCDESGVTREEVDLSGDTDSAEVDLAECDGTIDVYDAETDGDLIATAEIDCTDATVEVDCETDELGDAIATIRAPDADRVWYAIDYDNCDVADVERTELDLTGDTDSAEVDLAECDGTIDVYDAETDGNLIASAEIDCADATVDVVCEPDELGDAIATITAPDTDQVWYAVDYDDNCDVEDVPRTKVELMGSTDEVEVDLAECSGTITVHDAAESGTELADATFNCGDADVRVACVTDQFDDATATIEAPDLDTVWYEIDYHNCDVDDVDEPRGEVDLSGVDNDSFTFDIAECDGTIDVYDAETDGNLIASADIDCADADVSVDCVDEQATITAPDTDVVEYEIVYADCSDEDVPRTEVTLGEDDEHTVPVADCEGTINVYDLEGDLLASDTFDCVPTVTGLGADCEAVTADFTDLIAGDEVRVDVDVTDSTGASVATLSSGTVTMDSDGGGGNVTLTDTDNDGIVDRLVYTYSNEISGDPWQEVDVSVFLVDQNRFLDADPDTAGFQQTVTFDVGPCGCPDCPEGLEVKFEDPGIEVCDEKDGFVITEVERDSDGELESLCFATTDERPTFCELGVCVKAGPETQGDVVELTRDGEDEPCGLGDVPEYCVSKFDKHAISHVTIVCPGDDDEPECPEDGRGNGGGKGGGPSGGN